VAAAIVVAFLLGLIVGLLVGRRIGVAAARVTPSPAAGSPAAAAMGAARAATAASGRAGTPEPGEDGPRPADDILEKLRLVSEGKLDPSALSADDEPKEPRAAAIEQEAAERQARLTEAERRVLDRLRRQEPESGSS
jgi:hypothetical protein